jgi:hypothetical protein
MPHLRKGSKSKKLFESANLRFAELICGPPTFDKGTYIYGIEQYIVERLFTVRGQSYLSRLPKY